MKSLRLSSLLATAVLLPVILHAQSVPLQNTVITSDGPGEMVSTEKETTITFHTNVLVTGTNMRLTCDYLEVIVLRTGDPTATIGKFDKFRSMLATGNVHMVQGDREAACGRAEVLPDQEKVVLSDNPVVVDHDQNTRFAGEKITMLKGQRRVLIEKPILTAPPVKDLGVDKETKPVAPPVTPAPTTPTPAAPAPTTAEAPKPQP
jgi:lipopolysaccharide export system protein LptA